MAILGVRRRGGQKLAPQRWQALASAEIISPTQRAVILVLDAPRCSPNGAGHSDSVGALSRAQRKSDKLGEGAARARATAEQASRCEWADGHDAPITCFQDAAFARFLAASLTE
jgi:hypothetical protein